MDNGLLTILAVSFEGRQFTISFFQFLCNKEELAFIMSAQLSITLHSAFLIVWLQNNKSTHLKQVEEDVVGHNSQAMVG